MTSHIDIIHRLYDEMRDWGDAPTIAEIFHREFTYRGSLDTVLFGHAQFENFIRGILRALPDFRCEILETTEQDNRVVAKLRLTGTHYGEFFGFAPTNRPISWLGSAHFTFQEDLVIDLWAVSDVHSLIFQLATNHAPTPPLAH